MVIVTVLLALGLLGVVFTTAGSTSVAVANRQADATRSVMLQARDALIGWSAARSTSLALPNARPGELPCPDMSNDGLEDGTCVAGAVGRIPWKTLGIPEPKDAAGETLWYAIAGPFRIWNVNGNPINSDTKGNITIYQGGTATVTTTEAVAVIFAPGLILSGQARGTAAEQTNPANYLESAGGISNATPLLNAGAPSFIREQPSTTFNDSLLVITTAELMTTVEKRVAREMLTLLQAYRNAGGNWCNCYPWADHSDGFSNDDNPWGRVPLRGSSTSNTPDWTDVGITTATHPALDWLRNNEWWYVFFYAVSDSQSANHGGDTLTVDGVSGNAVVLITTGPAGAGRPYTGAWDENVHWSLYVDDSQNTDGGTNFQTPSSTAYARDRLYKL
jgi:hypothetical protein